MPGRAGRRPVPRVSTPDHHTGTGSLRLTRREIDELATGFTTIRDQEPLDDVADWANAVLALLEDEAALPYPD